MDKKLLVITFFLSLLLCIGVSLIEEKNKKIEISSVPDNQRFKEEVESLNGMNDENNLLMRTLRIERENPMVYTRVDELKEMIDNKETFAVYLGASDDAWCRSMIETLLEVADNLILKKIYYIDIHNTDNEKLNELFDVDTNIPLIISIKNGKKVKETSGISEKQTDPYMELTDEMKEEMYQKIECTLKYVTEDEIDGMC